MWSPEQQRRNQQSSQQSSTHSSTEGCQSLLSATCPSLLQPDTVIDDGKWLLVLGVISAPANRVRRDWIRAATTSYYEAGIIQRFVVGERATTGDQSAPWLCNIAAECMVAKDILTVDAIEQNSADCVEKSFRWWVRSPAAFPHAAFIGKTDDDSYNHATNLHGLLSSVRMRGLDCVYAGWPQYTSYLVRHNAGCGWSGGPRGAKKLASEMEGDCHRCLRQRFCYQHGRPSAAALQPPLHGPYPYAVGALELLSHRLATSTFSRNWTRIFVRKARRERIPGSRLWQAWRCQAEDSIVGYVVSQAATALQARLQTGRFPLVVAGFCWIQAHLHGSSL